MMLETAIQAAQASGEIADRYFESLDLKHEFKDDKSLVTTADREIEEVCAALIRTRHPDHGITGEEGESSNKDAPYQWVIDPIDGTRNFANSIPFFAISIAVMKDHIPVAGVVYNPVTRGLYAAEAGKGAFWNEQRMHVSNEGTDTALVTIGYALHEKARAYRVFANASEHVNSMRLFGSCALELALLANGSTEAFVCLGLNKWDYAAGWLLVKEAGGMITGCEGNTCDLSENYFIASNGKVHDAALALIRSVPA
ncbi:MAG: inositol monophosphatase [Minisyncoccia bacterium]